MSVLGCASFILGYSVRAHTHAGHVLGTGNTGVIYNLSRVVARSVSNDNCGRGCNLLNSGGSARGAIGLFPGSYGSLILRVRTGLLRGANGGVRIVICNSNTFGSPRNGV